MATNDVLRLCVLGRLHGQRIMQVHHYRQSTSQTGNQAPALVDAFRVDVEPSMIACLSTEYELEGYLCQRVNPLPVLAAYELPVVGVFGTVTGGSLPSSMAAVITKRTLLAGPKFRGRNFYAGVPLSHETDSKITPAGLNLWDTFSTALVNIITSGTGVGFVPIVYNRALQTSTEVSQCVARVILRNQRRRQVGRGE